LQQFAQFQPLEQKSVDKTCPFGLKYKAVEMKK
jgi:hypothetical protein